jgi:hypothetical protein
MDESAVFGMPLQKGFHEWTVGNDPDAILARSVQDGSNEARARPTPSQRARHLRVHEVEPVVVAPVLEERDFTVDVELETALFDVVAQIR